MALFNMGSNYMPGIDGDPVFLLLPRHRTPPAPNSFILLITAAFIHSALPEIFLATYHLGLEWTSLLFWALWHVQLKTTYYCGGYSALGSSLALPMELLTSINEGDYSQSRRPYQSRSSAYKCEIKYRIKSTLPSTDQKRNFNFRLLHSVSFFSTTVKAGSL